MEPAFGTCNPGDSGVAGDDRKGWVCTARPRLRKQLSVVSPSVAFNRPVQ